VRRIHPQRARAGEVGGSGIQFGHAAANPETVWVAMHLGGLVESKTRLDAARDRVVELERLQAL